MIGSKKNQPKFNFDKKSNFISDFLPSIKNEDWKYTNLKKNDVVLDIGANDGTLLKYFKQNVKTVGCEPANNLVGKLKKNCDYVLNDFWSINKFSNLAYIFLSNIANSSSLSLLSLSISSLSI